MKHGTQSTGRTSLLWSFAALALGSLLRTDGLQAYVLQQAAHRVLGQPDFNTSTPGTTLATLRTQGFGGASFAFDDTPGEERIFVSDTGNHRVMVYNISGGVINGQPAEFALGQPDATSGAPGLPATSSNLRGPRGIAFDQVHRRLFVADAQHNRVLVWNVTAAFTQGPADFVLGQPDFISVAQPNPPTEATMKHPTKVAYDAQEDRLFVTDSQNARVLMFDFQVVPLELPSGGIGRPSQLVLGQPDFFTNTPVANRSTMGLPFSITFDDSARRLFVSDTLFHRVLVYEFVNESRTDITSNGVDASYVLGQKTFTDSLPGTSQSAMNSPYGIGIDPVTQTLFLADTTNHRVLLFNLWHGISNGMGASGALGVAGFDAPGSGPVSAFRLRGPTGVDFHPAHGGLFVGDVGHNRVLVFDEVQMAGTPLLCADPRQICGTVKAAEDTTVTLANLPMELRDGKGRFMKTIKTDSSGNYSFLGEVDENYFVVPLIGRTQWTDPAETSVLKLSDAGARADVRVHGVRGAIEVSAPPSSAVLLTKTAYTLNSPPDLDPSAAGFRSGATGHQGSVRMDVPAVGAANSYYLTCWKPTPSATGTSYVRAPSAGSSGPFNVAPGQKVAVSCN